MTVDQRETIAREIDALTDTIHDVRIAIELLDGREVRAVCADLAIAAFKLGEKAALVSDQKYEI